VLLNLTTTSDNLTVLQEASFTNGAVEVAEATLVSEGAKPESALTFTEVTYPVRTIAHWIPVTRQNLEDLSWIRGYIDGRLLTGLARREDNQILNGNGTPPNLTGILNTSGTLALDAAYFSANPVNDAGTDNENVNRIRRAITRIKLASVGGAMPSFVVANPADVEDWETITDANRQYLLGGPFGPGVTRMWGLPLVQSENIADNTALVGDGTMAAVVDRRDAQIYTTDSHSDYFIRNLFVILAEERIAVVVFRPSAFAEVTLAA
jgi:HK97 family phage major capsid protein